MAFLDIKLSDKIAKQCSIFLEFNTVVNKLSSGLELRRHINNKPYLKFKMNLISASNTEKDDLLAFFRLVGGQKYSFRMKDFSDFVLNDEPLLTLGNGKFKLQKIYRYGNFQYGRVISKPCEKGFKIKHKGQIIPQDKYSVNYTTGLVEIFDNFYNELTADCEFDTEVRFASDRLSFEITKDGLFSFEGIDLIEIVA